MSLSLTIELEALCACSVLRTRWPVVAACIAIRAVSSSRISPTRITSGSLRRIVRSPRANVSPAVGSTSICPAPGIWYSTGSSIVTITTSRVVEHGEGGVQRGRLAAAGRADGDDRPVRPLDRTAHDGLGSGSIPRSERSGAFGAALQDPQHGLLAVRRRQDRDAQVHRPPADADPDAAVLRARRWAMSRPPITFRRREDRRLQHGSTSVRLRVTPSTRTRTTSRPSCGTKWMSDARCASALLITSLTNMIAGAASSRTTRSSLARRAPARPSSRTSRPHPAARGRLVAAAIASSSCATSATTSWRSVPSASRRSSWARMFVGSATAMTAVPFSTPDRERVVALGDGLRQARRGLVVELGFVQVDEVEPVLVGERLGQVAGGDQAEPTRTCPSGRPLRSCSASACSSPSGSAVPA